jgi:TM2 domain-containing membrane protein YozV
MIAPENQAPGEGPMAAVNPSAAPVARPVSNQKPCDACGETINVRAEICPKCGVRQRRAVSKAALILLAFFLGGVGGHKFYLGKYWQGALYLLFFWTWIPALVALIELVVYAFTSEERLNEKYSASGGAAGIIIAVVVGVFFMIMIIGIVAAVAIPAYQDYTVRAKVSEAVAAVSPWRVAIETYYARNKGVPASAADLQGEVPPAEIRAGTITLGERGMVVLTLGQAAGSRLAGKTILFQPGLDADGRIVWGCKAGTLEPKYRPAACR